MNVFSLGASVDLKAAGGGSSPHANGGRAQFELRVGTFINRELEVVSFEGHEKLSTPYVYDVVFASAVPVQALQVGLFGFPACLSIQSAGHEPRVIQGIAVAFEAIGAAEAELKTQTRRYMTRIVPPLWLLNHNRKYRVFQDKTAIEIARAVLADAGITPKIRLRSREYPPIPFVYQRGETDLEFLHHVLAVAGVFYYFEHANGLLDELLPGAGELGAIAGGLGGVVAGAASLSGGINVGGVGSVGGGIGGGLAGGVAGALGGVAQAASAVTSAVGATTAMVLCDKAIHTHPLEDAVAATAEGAVAAGLGALGSALGGAVGAVVGAVAAAVDHGLGAAIPYDGNGQAGAGTERIFAFRARTEVRPKSVTLRDWDPAESKGVRRVEKAATAQLDVNAGIAAVAGLAGGGGLSAAVRATLDVDAVPIATNRVSVTEYQRDAALLAGGFSFAEHALSQLRGDRITANGESDCRRLAPGYRFELARHPVESVNAEYVVTEVRSTAYAPDHLPDGCPHLYRSVFECVPASVDPRPAKPPPRAPFGPETATVVGPRYDDVHCDSQGRILVRFHWADASSDEGTCWVHWQEPWAGDGYGTHHLPRVGSEVLVQFLQHEGGRPIATGQLYTRAHVRPFPSPDEQLHVGITARVGGVTLDDTPGRESVRIRSDRELRVESSGRASAVLSSLDQTVEGARNETTVGDSTQVFQQDVSTEIAGSYDQTVRTNCSVSVGGSLREDIGGAVVRRIAGPVATAVELAQNALFEDDTVDRHLGHRTIIVGSPDAPRSFALHVEGFAWTSCRGGELVARDGFTVTCGDTRIEVTPKGVTISTPQLRFDAPDIALAGKSLKASMSDTLVLTSDTLTAGGSGSSLTLDDNATIVSGGKVRLNPPSGPPTSSATSGDRKPPTRVVLTDDKGRPLANRRVLVRVGGESGLVRTVVLDADGAFEFEGSEPVDVAFPEDPDAQAQA